MCILREVKSVFEVTRLRLVLDTEFVGASREAKWSAVHESKAYEFAPKEYLAILNMRLDRSQLLIIKECI